MPLTDSSCFSAYEYDPENRILTVTFRRNGETRAYQVPKYIYREFEAAESKGRYFNQSIKDIYEEV